MPLIALLVVLVGCKPPPETPTTPTDDPPTDTDLPTTPETTGTTGDTAPPDTDTGTVVDHDCDLLPPPGPFEFVAANSIQTEEDFDFDAAGYLLTQRNTDLQAVARTGQTHIVASNIGADAAGIRSLSTGDVMVAQPDTGAVRLVNYATGGSIVILGGLDFPNGLEATSDGMAFSSEYAPNGRIRLIDPYNENVTVIGRMEYPNNMALSPDEQVLYVVSSSGYFSGSSRIMAYDRDAEGNWIETPRIVHEHATMLGGITTDKCGNVYSVEFNGGTVFRIRAADSGLELIANLPPGSYYSSLRFAPGYGDWSREQLYATNRAQLFLIEIGLEGRHVLATAD